MRVMLWFVKQDKWPYFHTIHHMRSHPIMNEKCETSTGSTISTNRYMGKITQPFKKMVASHLVMFRGSPMFFYSCFFFPSALWRQTPAPKGPKICHPFRWWWRKEFLGAHGFLIRQMHMETTILLMCPGVQMWPPVTMPYFLYLTWNENDTHLVFWSGWSWIKNWLVC